MTARILTLAAVLGTATLAWAADISPAEQKLRETLRSTMLQLRTMQGERDTLQVTKDQLEIDKKALEDKLAAETKRSTAEAQAAQKELTETRAKLAEQEAQIKDLALSLEKWKASQKEASALAAAKETARARAALQATELQRVVEDQRRRNHEMYRLGTEVLKRYEGFGLGTAISAREPFIGLTRVRFENLIQDYSDKLTDQRIKTTTVQQ